MEETSTKYQENEVKFNQICDLFPHISTPSFYSTHLKIASKEWVSFLNEINSFGDNDIKTSNTGYNSKEKIAIKTGNKFIVNENLVKKYINKAHKENLYPTFGFFKANIVLDKLKEALISRKKTY